MVIQSIYWKTKLFGDIRKACSIAKVTVSHSMNVETTLLK